MDKPLPILYKISECAALISVSRSTAYAMALRGELPGAFRMGRLWRVSRVVLEAWIARQVEAGSGQEPPK